MKNCIEDMEKAAAAASSTSGCKPLTTFVQTNTDAFREVVQRLTGPSENDTDVARVAGIKRSTSTKLLHERRQYTKPKLEILKPPLLLSFRPCTRSPTTAGGTPSRLLPSPVGTPSTIFSKLSIGEDQEKNKGHSTVSELINTEEEERAIKERRFYLHPSPRSKPGYTEPELLTLFPLTSPKTTELQP